MLNLQYDFHDLRPIVKSSGSKLKMIQGALIILGIQNEIMGILSLKSMGNISENVSERCVQL